jgi:hypothetical protein
MTTMLDMMTGFAPARKLKVALSAALAQTLEIPVVIMLIHPFEAARQWQAVPPSTRSRLSRRQSHHI